MSIRNFSTWCETAVSGIIFRPDREAVYEELMNHLYDHYDDLVEQGVERETARQTAISAMGDAKEIAPQLAAIHRPFWGYFLRFTRWLLALALCAVVVCGLLWMRDTSYHDLDDSNGFDPFYDVRIEDDGDRRIFYTETGQSVQCDGYTLTLTKAAVWRHQSMGENGTVAEWDCFYFQIDVFNPRPWAAHTDITDWFWGVDSLGNFYDSEQKSIQNYAPFIVGNAYHTAPLTYTHDLYINGYTHTGAEWIEFHYDRSGRDIVFRIDLTGGDAA